MAEDDAAKYAQAVRFLTSLQSQKSQDVDTQRQFLRSKGLSEDVIDRAFHDTKRPEGISEEAAASQLASPLGSVTDSEAFEKAAKAFDEPITDVAAPTPAPPPEAPPKTYPRSPLALYHQPQQGHYSLAAAQSAPSTPQTRYDVLLSFFRSLCYFLVLGGGVTGVAVALYRTYLLPRMISTLDSRSSLLKHHLDQFGVVTNKIKGLRSNSLAPGSQPGAIAPLKGVLKKVQFADDINGDKKGVEEEDKKEAGDSERIDEKAALLEEHESPTGAEAVDESADKAQLMKPINLLEPVRASLDKLGHALRGEPTTSENVLKGGEDEAPTSTKAVAATVEDESDADSWVSEEDSDELEFDPYSQQTPSSSKRKHDPATTKTRNAAVNTSSASSSTSAASLQSSLSTLNAYINSQTYMASAHVYGGGRSFGMSGFGSTGIVTDKESSKAGDVAQIRADIRNLKGLLLSRRNFPTYRTSATTASTVGNPA